MTRYYPHVAVFVRGLHAHPTWRLVAFNWLKSPLPLSLVVAMSSISSLRQYLQAEKASRGEQQKDVPDSDFLISFGAHELKATNAKQADWKQLLSKAPEFTETSRINSKLSRSGWRRIGTAGQSARRPAERTPL